MIITSFALSTDSINSNKSYLYFQIPHIVSFAPAHSPVAGGVQINVSLSRELASSITDVTVAGVQCSDITLR